MMHAQPLRSVKTNAGGAILAIVSLACAPWMLGTAVRGRWVGVQPNDRWLVVMAVAVVVVTLLDWGRRLAGW
jgi:hypothetical protein